MFKLNLLRHYGPVARVDRLDIPWENKIDRAIFRGALTGMQPERHEGDTFVELCSAIPRCWFVYQLLHSRNKSLVDAKLVRTEMSLLPDVKVLGPPVGLYGKSVSMKNMLKCKMIIMLEGNDVSSGLKWALYSNSVVLMPEPKYTSWTLEELLVPWVHYVPLTLESPGNNASDGESALSDVEEKAAWVLSNDEHARKIAYNGKLWITDLLFHKDVKQDEHDIVNDMVGRYSRFWRLADTTQSSADRSAVHQFLKRALAKRLLMPTRAGFESCLPVHQDWTHRCKTNLAF